MLIAFFAPRVQLAKLCESALAQQFAASPALLLCDIGLLLRSQRTRGVQSCSGKPVNFLLILRSFCVAKIAARLAD